MHEDAADAYKSFARRFELFVRDVEPRYPHSAVYGFVRGRSTFENAAKHCGAKFLLKADIQNFFPSISIDRLYDTFIALGLRENVAQILAELSTVDNSLAQGLCSSPFLANLVCLEMDNKFTFLASKYGCVYTRYADDITISGNISVPTKEEIIDVLESEEFSLSERKFRITKPGQSHFVTGLSIQDTRPHVPKRLKKFLRQELYYAEKFGICSHIFRTRPPYIQREVNRLDGMVRYIGYIEHDSFPNLKQDWKVLLRKNGLKIDYDSWKPAKIPSFRFYIDESSFAFGGKKYLALCLCKTSSWEEIEATSATVLKKYLTHPFSAGDKVAIKKKKIHFADAHPELRKDYIEKLSEFEFRGYVIYGELTSPQNYQSLYLQMLGKILPHRLIGSDSAEVELIFEENQIPKSLIEHCVTITYESLKGGQRPSHFSDPTTVFSGGDSTQGYATRVIKGYAAILTHALEGGTRPVEEIVKTLPDPSEAFIKHVFAVQTILQTAPTERPDMFDPDTVYAPFVVLYAQLSRHRVVLARHGDTPFSKQKILTGGHINASLIDEGEDAAVETGILLKLYNKCYANDVKIIQIFGHSAASAIVEATLCASSPHVTDPTNGQYKVAEPHIFDFLDDGRLMVTAVSRQSLSSRLQRETEATGP